jgi:hypothetical protein
VTRGERRHQRAAAERTARVASTIRAHQEHGIGAHRTERLERRVEQGVELGHIGDPTAGDLPDHKVREERVATDAFARPGFRRLASPDEQQAHPPLLRRRLELRPEHVAHGVLTPCPAVLDEEPARAVVRGPGHRLLERVRKR